MRPRSWCPRSPSISRRSAPSSKPVTSGVSSSPSWWWRRARSGAAPDAFGHVRLGGIGDWLAGQLERRTGFEARSTTLGHIQRGGTPTAFDRVLATRFGVAAVDAVHDGDFGIMVALSAGAMVRIPLRDAVGHPKTVDLGLLEVAAPFLG